MLRRSVMTVLAFLALSVSAQAEGLVTDLQKNYETITTFRAGFIQRLTHKESGALEQRNGTLLFRKPLQVRWETAKPHPELLVITAKEIWDYLPDEDIVYRYSPELVQDSRSLIQVVTGQARLDKDFRVREEGTENGLSKLRLFPRDPVPQLVEAVIWVDAATRLIRRTVIVDFYGNTNDIEFTEITPDASLPGTAFSFTPPRGVDVEDRLGKDIQERELFK